MNWVGELIDLYEKNSDKAGIIEYRRDMPYVLLPPFHTTATAQIEVTIDENGAFLHAGTVDNGDKFTIIPVTEKSGSRTAGKEPHPLCDNLKYLAGDYQKYCGDDGQCFELYIAQLEKWCQSDYSHRKVQAIYAYLKKGTLIGDLLGEKVLKLDEYGVLTEKETIQGIPQTKSFVRFIIRSLENHSENDLLPDECWKDQSLQQCYIAYSHSLEKEKGLCYLSGNVEEISYLHSKKIRNEGDGAKLISANDSQNFTYRGRFAEKEEAFAVGKETSQKLHNALKWIIRKQGTFFDTMTVVTWESNKLSMPKWDVDTDKIVADYEEEWGEEEETDEVSDGNPITAEEFYKALNGYGKKISNTSSMILLGVDAATTGRLSLIEAKTMESSRYLKNIERWHKSCEWIHEKWKDGEKIKFWGMVGVRDVADLLFGVESNGSLTIVEKNSKKLYAEVAKRLIPCIWDGQRIPYDFVSRAVDRASTPMAYKNRKNWERILSLACSMVKKQRGEAGNKEEWTVALDKTCKDRNYLYGRLLAIADRIEYRTFDQEKDSMRVTNAKRYMSTFSQRPFETWKVIEENLQPYLNKLKPVERRYYENLMDEINQLFETQEYRNNSRLDGLYLLGFHSQSYDMKSYKQEKKEEVADHE